MKTKNKLSQVNSQTLLDNYLMSCGINQTMLELFKTPTSELIEPTTNYLNINKACEILNYHLNSDNNKIAFVVDCDGDGYFSAALLSKYCLQVNPNVDLIFLFHQVKLHGLQNMDIMKQIEQEKPHLVICPDSASADYNQHRQLFEQGIQCIVLDHHPTENDSEFAVVVNNKLSPQVINKEGSGALVTWKTCKRYDEIYGYNYAPPLMELVYFSLLSDICPMNSMENRMIAEYCRKNINHQLLKQLCNDLTKATEMTNEVLSWEVIPKISAIVRKGTQEDKTNLFFALVSEKQNYIDKVLQNCKKLHKVQGDLVKDYVNSHINMIDTNNNIIFELAEDIDSEFRGLVASRYSNQFNKPVLLYKQTEDNEYTGSVRSNIDIKQQLSDSGLFTFVAGHDAACGVGFSKNNLEQIKAFANTAQIDDAEEVLHQFNAKKIPKYLFGYFDDYSSLWGKNIPKPKIRIDNIKINGMNIYSNRATIRFQYEGVNYYKEFCSNVFKSSIMLGEDVDLNVSVIGYPSTNIYNEEKQLTLCIDKMEVSVEQKTKQSFEDIF